MSKVIGLFLLALTIVSGGFAYQMYDKHQSLEKVFGSLQEQNASLEQALIKLAFIKEVYREASYAVIDPHTEEMVFLANEILESELAKPLETEFYSCYDRVVHTTVWGSMGVTGVLENCIEQVKDNDVAKRLFALGAMRSNLRMACGHEAGNRYEQIEKCALSGKYRFAVGLDAAYFRLVTQGLTVEPIQFSTGNEH